MAGESPMGKLESSKSHQGTLEKNITSDTHHDRDLLTDSFYGVLPAPVASALRVPY